MKQDQALEAVAQYREKAYHEWKRLTLLSFFFMGSLAGLIHATQLFSFLLMHKECCSLEREIAHIQTSKMARIKEAKHLKDTEATAKLLSKPVDIAATLRKVALAIPEHTLLTELSYDRETFFTLTGYCSTTEQLQFFLTNLRGQACAEVTLQSSQDDAAGMKFTITLLD